MAQAISLRFKSLQIQRFKAIGDATIEWHPRVNVITGPNNSGKTTVLEAIALWVESFDRMANSFGKAVVKRGIRRGDWSLDGSLAHHSEVVSVRSPGFDDLFHGEASSLVLTATLADAEGDFRIPISIRKARGGHYEFSCLDSGSPTFNKRLNAICTKWPRPFRVLFASPVAAVLTNEEFLTPGKAADMIRQRRSAEVLRNRIYRLHGNANEFQQFKDDVSRVLTGSIANIEIEVRGNPSKDVFVQVLATTSRTDRPRDISLLGSGSLQVIEVLLNLYLEESDLDLVLLDEPDSHIHRDIQRRLLEIIEEKADRAQVFATTHNESLLRATGWDRVFHLSPAPVEAPRVFRSVGSEQLVVKGRQHGLVASPLRNVLSSVGAETALDFLNALESRHFLLVEGSSDAVLIDRMFEVGRLGGARESAMYWSLNGIDGGLRSLSALRVILQNIRNDRTLWEKARLVLDRDLLTAEHANGVQNSLKTCFDLRTNFWLARTAEGTLLSGGPSAALAQLLRRAVAVSHQHDVTPAVAQQACQTAWASLGERLHSAHDQPDLARLHGTLEQRQNLLNEVLKDSRPIPGSIGQLQQTVSDFHRRAVAEGQYWNSADKNDVNQFVCEALQHMGISEKSAQDWCKGPSWFQALISEMHRAQDFPALAAMWEWLREP